MVLLKVSCEFLFFFHQVTANMQAASFSTTRNSLPSLGLAWASQIHCRINMSRSLLSLSPPEILKSQTKNCVHNNQQSVIPTFRMMKIVFAPHLPPSETLVCIDNAGIHGLDKGTLLWLLAYLLNQEWLNSSRYWDNSIS